MPQKKKSKAKCLFLFKKQCEKFKKKWPGCCQKKHVYLALTIISIAVILYNFRSQFIVATVNGQPIFRTALIRELEKQAGNKILDSLIIKNLIDQEAQKNGVKIPETEIDEEIKKIEEDLNQQQQDLDQLLAIRGMTRKDLKNEIRLQKIAEALSATDIEISDDEVNEAFETRKQLLPEGSDEDAAKEELRNQLKEQKQLGVMQAWVDNLRQEAKINYLLLKPPVENQ